ncbi:ABC transporter permease [Aquimarina sediminis]|uniref:ABC transporter permease n=1 Tax=Aquimarina sediminis TaxID=2070536 RepID=UPI000CA04DAB|nr:ABC transporter permease [Aquimarina sediminis]
MIRNYIKIAWRNLLKNKTFSFINIFGLSVGLATCLLLTLYIMDETSYDSHHKDADRVYRIVMESAGEQLATSSAPMAETLKNEFPEIAMTTRLLKFPNVDKYLLKNNQKNTKFYETNGYYVDSTFFKILTYDFKYGDASALNGPNKVVLSEKVAYKLFGDKNPLNEIIDIEIPYGTAKYTVTGVFRDNKYKSHIAANLLLSMKNTDIGEWVDAQEGLLGNNLFHSYIKLKKGTSIASVEDKLPEFVDRHIGDQLREIGFERHYFMQPLSDIYLKSDMMWEISANGSMTYIYIFSAIAAFLLLIACINFMNLSTARSQKRAKEVGMRKVLGAKKEVLVFQFLGESLIICLIALAIALILVILSLPLFNAITNKDLLLFHHPGITIFIAGLALLTGLISGLYPAFYLSSFKPITVLKGTLVNSISAKTIRKGLVVFQFAISASLILVAGVIWKQMDYLKNKDLGFKKEQQLLIPYRSSTAAENYIAFKSEILKNPNVISATAGDSYPGLEVTSDNSFYGEGKTIEDNVYTRYGMVKDDYLETLEYELLSGRTFSKNSNKDSLSIILNEMAVLQLGYKTDNAVGRKIYYEWNNEKYDLEIIGVIKDFNFKSLHEPVTPYGLRSLGQNQPNYFIATLREGGGKNTMVEIEKTWKYINPDTPFEYSFLDQNFDNHYRGEQQTSNVIFCFMFIAIFIACIGLFGLALFTTEQRRKEVGIRRVLGASIMSITTMQLKDFLKLVLIAMVIASPLAYYTGNRWLQNFAYQVDVGWQLFVSAALVALFIAFVTVGFQVIKAAIANPVTSLRTE